MLRGHTCVLLPVVLAVLGLGAAIAFAQDGSAAPSDIHTAVPNWISALESGGLLYALLRTGGIPLRIELSDRDRDLLRDIRDHIQSHRES